MPWVIRNASEAEVDRLAQIWYDTWHAVQARIVPAELARVRTLESFRQRLCQALPDTRVVGPPGDPIGFCIVKGDELYQLFVAVAAHGQGSGAAAALLADAEARLQANGVTTA